jgi:putative endopeptidase
MNFKWIAAAVFAGVTCISCQTKPSKNTVDALAANVDTTVSPAKDFFDFANGGWIKKNPIPSEEGGWGIGNLVVEENLKRLREINEKAAAEKAEKGSASQKIGDFWATAMDSAAIEKAGVEPLKPMMDRIMSITDTKSLLAVMATLSKMGVGSLVAMYVGQDAKQSDVMALNFYQAGTGLPEREYYFKTDSSSVNIRNKYVQHMANVFKLLGDSADKATAAAQRLLAIETTLAQSHRKLEDLRDPYANYNKMSTAAFAKLSPGFDWMSYFEMQGLKNVDSVIVGQPAYYQALGNALKTVPIDDWKHFLRYRLVSEYSGALPEAFGKEAFEFSRLFSGAKERKARWKRTIQTEEGIMGELLGKLFVQEFFNEKAKKRYEDMVEAIRSALKDRINGLSWMGDSTKQKALAKLAAMKKKVGYPDKWKDFSKMDIGRVSYVQNLMNASEWWFNYNINKLGKPVDRDEWDMFPQTYNAYYNPSNNEIVLPAGIFTVPGYRDEELDDALVYGYAGASTIGHEITHGFDDEGRKFDAKGNLVSWWTAKDETEFNKRADVMVKQFNNYVVIDSMRINGKATLGENIADLGGILLGVDAFKKTESYKKGEKIANYTPMQRYFMGYALGWLSQSSKERLRNQLQTDVHSPAKYRVNGPFVSVDDFYTAFNVKPGDPMYLADSLRVRIW